jgi:hypothetical protein
MARLVSREAITRVTPEATVASDVDTATGRHLGEMTGSDAVRYLQSTLPVSARANAPAAILEFPNKA